MKITKQYITINLIRENGTYEKNHIKAKITSFKRYGSPTYRNIEKKKKTSLERYGSKTYNNPEKAQPNKRKTMEDSGQWISLEDTSDWQAYKKLVLKSLILIIKM